MTEGSQNQILITFHDKETAEYVRRVCRRKGTDLATYILDNFEWDKGFWPRFGLISVNPRDFSRKIKIESCDRYREIIEKGL